jgi:hypothetical protein
LFIVCHLDQQPFRQLWAFIGVTVEVAFFYRVPKQAFEAWDVDEVVTVEFKPHRETQEHSNYL